MSRERQQTVLERLGNRLFGKVALHPGKNYLYSNLVDDIETCTDGAEVAADISSAHFDNAEYFRSRQYIGVDIDFSRLQSGKSKFSNSPDYEPVLADIRQPVFRPNSLDVIVCTHTLSHLDTDEHLPLIERFLQYLTPGGDLLLQIHDEAPTDEIETRLRESFDTVERTDYNNAITRSFQQHHTDDDQGGSYNPTMTGWQRYVNAATIVTLSLVERLGWPEPVFTYLKCVGR